MAFKTSNDLQDMADTMMGAIVGSGHGDNPPVVIATLSYIIGLYAKRSLKPLQLSTKAAQIIEDVAMGLRDVAEPIED